MTALLLKRALPSLNSRSAPLLRRTMANIAFPNDFVSYPPISYQDTMRCLTILFSDCFRRSFRVSQNKDLYTPLAELDPEVNELIKRETWRQFSGLELIASEVRYVSTVTVVILLHRASNLEHLCLNVELDQQGSYGGQWLDPH